MPLGLNDDAAFLDSVGLVRPRTGPAGVSRQGGVQGSAPDSGLPSPPQPQGIPSAPPGRPPASGGGAPSSAPMTPAAPTAIQITVPQQSAPVAPAAPAGPAAPAAPAAPGGGPASVSPLPSAISLPGMPRLRDMAKFPAGAQIMTPYGPVIQNPTTGKRVVQLTPEGRVLYARDVQALESKLAPNPFGGDPNAPRAPLTPGRTFYDPFGGGYVS